MIGERGLMYLASPYSHVDPAMRAWRFDVVCRVAARLLRQGIPVLSPIAHSHPIAMAGELPIDWTFWQRYDRLLIAACPLFGVLDLDGWHCSAGVQAEMKIAISLRRPIEWVHVYPEELAGFPVTEGAK